LRIDRAREERGRPREQKEEEEACASANDPRSVGGPMLRASHRLSSRRYADPAARLPYFNASVIGSPPATGILKGMAMHRGAICSSRSLDRFE